MFKVQPVIPLTTSRASTCAHEGCEAQTKRGFIERRGLARSVLLCDEEQPDGAPPHRTEANAVRLIKARYEPVQ